MSAHRQRICLIVSLTFILCVCVAFSKVVSPLDIRHHKDETTAPYHISPLNVTETLSPGHTETHPVTPYQQGGYPGSRSCPCILKPDVFYVGGMFVNCSGKGITKIEQYWFPANTTTITLDHNNISTLVNGTFSHLKELRNLNISNSNVSRIEVDTLRGLSSLEILDLENNNLSLAKHAFPGGMFRHVSNLTHLFIAYNNGQDMQDMKGKNYSMYIDIFDFLPKLQSLSIDANNTLHLGFEFGKFQNLTSLVLFCGATHRVFNNSFDGLANVKLKHLEMRGFLNEPFYFHFGDQSIHFELGVFQPLRYLESLTLYVCPVGNKNIIKSLRPFQNRNMTSLILHGTSFPIHYAPPNITFEDGIIYAEDTKEVDNMCVSHFAWRDSQLFAISPEAIYNNGIMRCIKTFDMSSNRLLLMGWLSLLYVLPSYPNLETLILLHPQGSEQKPDRKGLLPPFRHKKDLQASQSLDHHDRMNPILFRNNVPNNERGDIKRSTYDHNVEKRQYQRDVPRSIMRGKYFSKLVHSAHDDLKSARSPHVTLYLPPNAKSFQVNNYDTHKSAHIWGAFVMKNGENFKEMYVVNMPAFLSGSGRVLGLHNLSVVDISGSQLDVEDYFVDDFPGLENLTMRNVKPENFFKRIPCKRLVRKMPKLRHLDISDNGLNWLLPGTFSSTPELLYLGLAKNRFSNIPFDLSSTPKLRVLDLIDNAILYLTPAEMTAIDDHLNGVESFLLKLQGNGLVCVCSKIHFLAWQQITLAKFDNDGNYSCTTQDGHLTFTADIGEDIEGFWRQCQGRTMLMVSLVIASLMAVAMLTTCLVGRFKTALVAFVLRVVAPKFRPMTSQDYQSDVFIGYADDDVHFVRHILGRYLEEKMHLKTFIHHRDFRQGYEGEQFFLAIQKSWRVLLVITKTFLQRYNMADIVMKFASLSVSPVNQGRVFVLVEESQLHAIPDYLHNVLDDTRIIVLHDLNQPLSYEQTQSIKNCLLPVH